MKLGQTLLSITGLALVTGASACSAPVTLTALATGALAYASWRHFSVKEVKPETVSQPHYVTKEEALRAYHQLRKMYQEAEAIYEPKIKKHLCQQFTYKDSQALTDHLDYQQPDPECFRPPLTYQTARKGYVTKDCQNPDLRINQFHTHHGYSKEEHFPCTAVCAKTGVGVSVQTFADSLIHKRGFPLEEITDGADLFVDDVPVYLDHPICRPPADIQGQYRLITHESFALFCKDIFEKQNNDVEIVLRYQEEVKATITPQKPSAQS